MRPFAASTAATCCVCGRFKDYDGPLLEEFIGMRYEVPEVFYNTLLKDNISMTDILKIRRAIKQLYK